MLSAIFCSALFDVCIDVGDHHCIIWHLCNELTEHILCLIKNIFGLQMKYIINKKVDMKTEIKSVCFACKLLESHKEPEIMQTKGRVQLLAEKKLIKKAPFKGQGQWRWCEYSCMTSWSNLALVLSQPTSNGDQLHPCQALKSDPAIGPKYLFAFSLECCVSWDASYITDMWAFKKGASDCRGQVSTERQCLFSAGHTNDSPCQRKISYIPPPVPKTPQLPNPPHTFVSSCPFPRSYVLGADSSNGATELQPADLRLRIQFGSCCQQFAW